MAFDPQDGLYLFEVILGFEEDGEKQFSSPCLVQADDTEEAEEKVMDYLDDLDLEHEFWIEEMGDAWGIQEYERKMEEIEEAPYPVLAELTEDEFTEFLGS